MAGEGVGTDESREPLRITRSCGLTEATVEGKRNVEPPSPSPVEVVVMAGEAAVKLIVGYTQREKWKNTRVVLMSMEMRGKGQKIGVAEKGEDRCEEM